MGAHGWAPGRSGGVRARRFAGAAWGWGVARGVTARRRAGWCRRGDGRWSPGAGSRRGRSACKWAGAGSWPDCQSASISSRRANRRIRQARIAACSTASAPGRVARKAASARMSANRPASGGAAGGWGAAFMLDIIHNRWTAARAFLSCGTGAPVEMPGSRGKADPRVAPAIRPPRRGAKGSRTEQRKAFLPLFVHKKKFFSAVLLPFLRRPAPLQPSADPDRQVPAQVQQRGDDPDAERGDAEIPVEAHCPAPSRAGSAARSGNRTGNGAGRYIV